jgi:uncharacterized protein YjgD (DUF1641 family)
MTTNGNGSSDLEHLIRAANDALTDDMVTRIAQTAADGMDLVDQVNRSGLQRALPAIASLVESGDLDRLVRLARLYGSAEDALTDDMISRVAEAVADGLTTLDRFNRGGAGKLVGILERMNASGTLDRLAETLPRLVDRMEQVDKLLAALESADASFAQKDRSRGGIGGLFKILSARENQDALHYLIGLGKELRNSSRPIR